MELQMDLTGIYLGNCCFSHADLFSAYHAISHTGSHNVFLLKPFTDVSWTCSLMNWWLPPSVICLSWLCCPSTWHCSCFDTWWKQALTTNVSSLMVTVYCLWMLDTSQKQISIMGMWTTEMEMWSGRVGIMVERFKIALDCFFAVWFVVGTVWVFGGHSSSSEAPNLYRQCSWT